MLIFGGRAEGKLIEKLHEDALHQRGVDRGGQGVQPSARRQKVFGLRQNGASQSLPKISSGIFFPVNSNHTRSYTKVFLERME